MDSQLNPNAAEFVPVSSPKRTIKISAINDSFVAGSPMKTTVMDDIMIPSQQEFDEEISARPHEIDEKDSSSNGNHAAHSDYDFYTERQKIMNPATAAAAAGLDESEISSTKAEYGDETISFLCTTSTDLHKTDISAMEESFGDSDCDIYNRDNPMTISYTPCDFKAAFNKEVDLNAVHDLSDGDLEDENYCSEIQTSESPKATDLGRRIELDILSNGDSLNEMQTSSLLSKDENTFLKFQDSVEPKNTEFIQVELERHSSSSPIVPSFEHDFSKEQDDSFNLIENKEGTVSVGRQEEKKEEAEKETERAETHKEAEYVDDEKDIAIDDDIVPNKDNSELIVDKPVEIATDLIQSEIFKDTTISQDEYNFLSSTIDESSKLNSLCMPSIEKELMETSAEPLKNGLISSMENLKLTTEEEERPIMVFNLSSDVSEFQPSESSIDSFFSGEPALSDVASKQPLLEDSLTRQPDSTENYYKESSSFLPTLVSETVSDNDRPTENLLKLNETTTQVPTIDHIEESKADEYPQSYFEDIREKPSQHMNESVCPINTDDKQIYMNWEDSPERKSIDKMKIDDTFTLNLSELDNSKDLIMQQPDSTENHHKESSSFLPTLVSGTVSDNDRPTENLSKPNETTTEVPIIDNIEKSKADEYSQSFSFEDITERKSTDKMEIDVNEFDKVNDTVTLNLSESIQEFTGLEKQLEPENFTPEESPMAELTPSIEEDKIMDENIVEHKESVVQEAVEENLLLDTKEEEALEAKEDVEIVQVTKITESIGTTESTELSKPTELVTPIDDIVIEKASDAFDLVKPVSTPADIEETIISTGIVESEKSANNVEMTKSVDTTTMEMIETAEIAESANITKSVDITEAVPVTIMQDVEEQKVAEPLKVEKSPKVEEEKATSAIGVLAAGGIAAVAAGTVTAAIASNASNNKTKVKPTMTRSMKPGSSSTKAAPPKSTPTSPSKTVTLTAKSTSSTATTTTSMKKPTGSAATRPKHLDTAPSKSLTSTAAKSTTTTKVASKTSTTTTSSTTKTAMRPSSAQPKSKPLPASARSTASSVEKKSALNSDAKPSSKTTIKAATKSTSTSTSAKANATKTTTSSRTSTTAITSTTTTTTTPSTTGKLRPTSATTVAKSPAKLAGTNAMSGGGLLNATKSKTTTTSNNTTKTSRTSLAKSPMIDKQIKETANKQISMSRTTSSPITKTTRSSVSATTTLNSNTTKRLSSQKSTSTTSTSAHSPIKKVTSKVSSGQSSGATKSSSTTKVKVMQNGTADNAEISKTTTTTTTTIITTDSKNEDDVPKKDLSPVVAHTDNQLISSAD